MTLQGNPDTVPINLNQIDLILPYQKIYSFPLSHNLTGSSIIDYVNQNDIHNYVICCIPPGQNEYTVFYSDDPDYSLKKSKHSDHSIASLIKLTTPFPEIKFEEIFISIRTILTSRQRMTIRVMLISDFQFKWDLLNHDFDPFNCFSKTKEEILVQLPTNEILKIPIKTDKRILRITKKIYKKMCELYGESNLTKHKFFQFSTVQGDVPSSAKNLFKDEICLMKALNEQKRNPNIPQFKYTQLFENNVFEDTVKEYIQKLELSPIPFNDEIQQLNASLSAIRKEVDAKRVDELTRNPLLTRMRISRTDPPIDEYLRKKFPEYDSSCPKNTNFKISIKIELRNAEIGGNEITGKAISIDFWKTPRQAIEALFEILKKLNNIEETNQSQPQKHRTPTLPPSHSPPPPPPPPPKAQTTNDAKLPPQKPTEESKTTEKESIPTLNAKARRTTTLQKVSKPMAQATMKKKRETLGNIDQKNTYFNYLKSEAGIQTYGIYFNKKQNESIQKKELKPPVYFDEDEPPPPNKRRGTIVKIEVPPTQSSSTDSPKASERQSAVKFSSSAPIPEISNLPVNEDDDDDYSLEKYVLVLQGTDEVLSGNTPLYEFVCVRQFILSGKTIMFLTLEKKQSIIQSIQSKELKIAQSIEPSSISAFRYIHPILPPRDCQFTSNKVSCVPHTHIHHQLSIYIHSLHNIQNDDIYHQYFVSVSLINGTALLCDPVTTNLVYGHSSIYIDQLLTLNLPISSIPNTARLAFTLHDTTSKKIKGNIGNIATYNFSLYRYNGWMNQGKFTRKMWLDKGFDFFLTTCESNEANPISIVFSVEKFHKPAAFICEQPSIVKRQRGMTTTAKLSIALSQSINKLKNSDPLNVLTDDDKTLLWNNREIIKKWGNLLPPFLQCIDFSKPEQVNEIPQLLEDWTKPSPTEAMMLLDAKFADHKIREYAVKCLEQFTDTDIMLYMLQLVQALKYELYDDSPLAQFLVRRGLQEPKILGHQFFWQLISEAHVSYIRQRFSSILVNFVYGMSSYRDELFTGYEFTQKLVKLNQKMCNLKYNEATIQFREELKNFEVPKEFHLPIDPRLIVDAFIIDKCKVMNSKKKPFFLTFHNAAPFTDAPVQMMFKVGDDLRQDQLTLQIMKVMEHLWIKQGFDYRMRCYGVLPTGLNQGFIEVVQNSITEAALQVQAGTLKGVFDKSVFTKFLVSKNGNNQAYQEAVENFRLSSAGYAVSTCVLGIADRHPGNIMVQDDGHFFHIDFGHFLGNFKTKLGYQREKAPFHFSPAAAYVFGDYGSKEFKLFEEEASIAYNILRHRSSLLITLLILMIGTGIPELQKPEDIYYMKKMLNLHLIDDSSAGEEFKKMIKESLESTRTLLNNLFHNIKTG